MNQSTINQRLKILIEKLGLSVRSFSALAQVSPNNTQNYLGKRQIKPKREYLDQVMRHFSHVNETWLLTGEGEPFITLPTENTLPTTNAKKISRSQIIGTNHGTAYQKHNTTSASNEALKDKLISVEKERDALKIENEWLRMQLKTQEALIAAKEETISVLRGPHHSSHKP